MNINGSNNTSNTPRGNDDGRGDHTPEPVRGDRLDALLRAWHDEHRDSARAKRDEILEHIAVAAPAKERGVLARIGFSRALAAAAVLAVSTLLVVLFTNTTERTAFADGGIVQVAEGGALDALDKDGNSLGPCPLQHTDVKVEISGLFARTVVEQTYANPYPRTIEAVYTFPLSNRAAVDRMTMVIRSASGEKNIEGEVKERTIARAMYEEARESGYVASLLEQERPNIFTQSVANIEPGAVVKVRIATIELAQRKNGVAEYVFPMVVGPRYIPGHPASMPTLPEGWSVREGVVLRAPAGVELAAGATIAAARIADLLEHAIPVRADKNETIDQLLSLGEGIHFTAKYGNGSAERGVYFPARGLGELNGRFFYAPLGKDQGTGFAGDTNQVPDASRITPMPVKPSERAGHDISVSVTIDSGGAAISDVASELHAVSVSQKSDAFKTVTLDEKKSIPNRDFILRWKTAETTIEPGFFAHVSDARDPSADPSVKGGYFALMIEPPARVAPATVRPRELIFVLDTSGSMNGFPMEKSKALARKAIAAMRPTDTFNFITFAGATRVLWSEPRSANDANRKEAEDFVNGAYGAGGTEMMSAINAALVQDGRSGIAAAKLLDLPADGRTVRVATPSDALVRGTGNASNGWSLDAGAGRTIPVDLSIAIPANPKKLALLIDGAWETRDGNRVFVAKSAKFEDSDARTRIVFFLTDGYVGNDQAIVQAVRDNARASRVFSFGIGNSVNRFLMEEMARAGRGTCEIVTLADDADGVVERLTRRIESPVLTDIELDIAASLGIHDMLPGGDHLPDLYDQEPIVLLGRFDHAANGTITVRGRTGAGAWEKTINVALPAADASHDVVKTLWARAKVDDLLAPKLAQVESQTLDAPTKRAVIRLGESYAIATPYTSFVAIEKSRVVVGGKPMLVAVPVELPDGTNWAGFFGENAQLGGQGQQGVALDFSRRIETTDWFGVGGDAAGLSLDATIAPPGAALKPSADANRSELADEKVQAAAGGKKREVFAKSSANSADKSKADTGVMNAATAPPSMPAIAMPSSAASSGAVGNRASGAAMPAPSAAPVAPPAGGAGGGMIGGTGGGTGGGMSGGASGSAGNVFGGLGGPGGGRPGAAKDDLARRRDRAPAGGEGGRQQRADPSSALAPDVTNSLQTLASEQNEILRFDDAEGRVSEKAATGGDAANPRAANPRAAKPRLALTPAERDRLVRVLDRRLVFLALASLLGEGDKIPALAAELGVELQNGFVQVAMKVATSDKGELDGKTLDAIRAAGATISADDAKRGLVIARVPVSALAKIAAIEGVKRVEPLAP